MRNTILILVAFLVCLSCSTDDESVTNPEINEVQFIVRTSSSCEDGSSFQEHCVIESVYKSVTSEWTSTSPNKNCNKISFQDKNGVPVEAIVSGTSKGMNICQSITN